MLILTPYLLYAQNNKPKQLNNRKENKKQNEFLRVNKAVSQELGKAAEKIDKNISPPVGEGIEKNKTNIYFIMGGDFADNGDVEGNFRYGGQLHLPRFQKYWKLKFSSDDENRDRGQSALTRGQRARRSNDDFFLGVSFAKRWKDIDVDYKPQLAFSDGLGLDHSIEAKSEFKAGDFSIHPSLEFFAHHSEGLGSSAALGFRYFITKSLSIGQSNDGRFVYLDNNLLTNHTAGLGYTHNDRWNTSLSYFRGFENGVVGGYRLSAYGYYLNINYAIYQEILMLELKPYIVYERDENYERVNGVVLNFRVTF